VSSVLYWLLWNGPWPGSELYGCWSTPPNPIDFIRQALLIGADRQFNLDQVLWSLVHELRLSLLLPFLVAVPMFRGLQGSLMLVLAGLLIFALSVEGRADIENVIGLGPTIPDTFTATAYFSLPFLTGAALSLGQWQRWRPSAEQRRFALVTALFLFCSSNDMATIIASVLLILLSGHSGGFRDFLLQPPLLLLGRVSFSLYLIHMPVMLAVQHGFHNVLSEAWMEPLTIVLSLPAAWLLHVLAERPALLLSRRIKSIWPSSRRDPIRDIAIDPSVQRQS
jgi:peptidoglycan/LPS O-acetylase OafA/YrhL